MFCLLLLAYNFLIHCYNLLFQSDSLYDVSSILYFFYQNKLEEVPKLSSTAAVWYIWTYMLDFNFSAVARPICRRMSAVVKSYSTQHSCRAK